MIIRSQDKKKTINFNNVKQIEVQGWGDIFDICVRESNFCENIGAYSTEEKAIKVLDMICEAYQKCQDCKSGLRKIADTDFVFQMPQDFEV